MKPRVIVIALDAASPRLLRDWAEDGTLPNLRTLLERGLTGDIAGLDGFFIGSTWPSFYTGVNPGRHGFHYQLHLEPGTYRLRPVAEGAPTKVEPFWRTLSDAGRRVAILDVPLSRLDPQINGMQVVEWGVHDHLYGFGAVPETFAARIVRDFGAHPVGAHCDAARRSPADYSEFIDRLVRSIEAKTRLTSEVLAQEPWDFLIQVFSESHCVGHQCWHLRDPSHPAFDASVARITGDPLRRVYRALDDAVGRLMQHSDGATLVVMSAHGMTHWYGATFLLKDMLFALGVTTPQVSARSAAVDGAALVRGIWRLLPERARQALAPLRDAARGSTAERTTMLTSGMEPSTSRCFPISNGLGTGAIRLNVAGREPLGALRPGAEVKEFVERLSADLLSFTDADSGERAIDRVVQVKEICEGPALDTLPDLVIEWSRSKAIGSTAVGDGRGAAVRLRHPRIGIVEGENGYGRTGEHEPGGFFAAMGPTVRGGVLDHEVSLFDFAPTVLRSLGCHWEGFDGQPIPGFPDD